MDGTDTMEGPDPSDPWARLALLGKPGSRGLRDRRVFRVLQARKVRQAKRALSVRAGRPVPQALKATVARRRNSALPGTRVRW